jgi:ElaA protein
MSVHQQSATLRRAWSADLTPAGLYALLRLRVSIFVIEQNCPYEELDGLDLLDTTRHFWLETDSASDPIAYLRLLEEIGGFRIGRVCSVKELRGKGLSRRLMEAALAEVGKASCVLEAQVQAQGFYAGFGFVADGEPYLEDDILHITMRRAAR